MISETKTCQNCKTSFTIEPEDFSFYEKMQVPPPTFCPMCRKQRRLSWRNDMTLYSRACNLCKKPVVSIYSIDKPFPVYCARCWWSDGWDPKAYAQEYNFSKSFFAQFKELQSRVPALATVNDHGVASVNCEYTQDFAFGKNCYMVFIAWKIEDCLYSCFLVKGKEIVDSLSILEECEAVYEAIHVGKCYKCRNIYYSAELTNCSFCYDCRDCSDCFMSVGLRHKKYCFKNRQHTKEAYEKIFAEYRLNTWNGQERAHKEFVSLLLQYPRKFSNMRKCVNCTGDALINGKNSQYCFTAQSPENCKWVENSDTPKDSYDLSVGGELQECYEGITPDHSYRGLFTIFSWKNTDATYVDACHSSKDLFGCCGLKKAQYCILNKQYTKEEYEALIPKIRTHMSSMPYVDKRGISYAFGEFYPSELSPFGYNETVARDFFPIEKESAEQAGFNWQDKLQFTTGKETLKNDDIPESINDAGDAITNEMLACSICNRNYRIVPDELKFYKKMGIPIPRKCFFCRHAARLNLCNPHQLWHRKCQCAGETSQNSVYRNTAPHRHSITPCPEEFETSYGPERQEIVYCEACYNAEVV